MCSGVGGDTQKILPYGSREEIREHVRRNIEIFTSMPGGFVFTQVHNIQQDVPVENVEAMFEAAYEFGTLVPGAARQPFSTQPD